MNLIAASLRRNFRIGTLALVALSLVTAPALAESRSQNPSAQPAASNPATEPSAPHNWTTDQILTATVHQAWILSGKDEANFFEIVKELAAISARNRNLVLPDDPAAGRRAGDYIKTQAKADHDQLLYDIVDKSVRMTGKPASTTASTH